jgi:hypothetical protein
LFGRFDAFAVSSRGVSGVAWDLELLRSVRLIVDGGSSWASLGPAVAAVILVSGRVGAVRLAAVWKRLLLWFAGHAPAFLCLRAGGRGFGSGWLRGGEVLQVIGFWVVVLFLGGAVGRAWRASGVHQGVSGRFAGPSSVSVAARAGWQRGERSPRMACRVVPVLLGGAGRSLPREVFVWEACGRGVGHAHGAGLAWTGVPEL